MRALPIDEAVRLVQVSERARQGRLRASFMKEIRREEERFRHGRNGNGSTLDPEAAATLIQKVLAHIRKLTTIKLLPPRACFEHHFPFVKCTISSSLLSGIARSAFESLLCHPRESWSYLEER